MSRLHKQKGRMYECFQVFKGNSPLKRLLGEPRHRWKDNVSMYRKEICINTSTGLVWLMKDTCECNIEPLRTSFLQYEITKLPMCLYDI